MIRSSRKTVASGLLIGALLIPAIAGCEAGDNAPTLEFHQAAAGAYANSNDISISNAFLLGAPSGGTMPVGSSVGMFLSLYNSGMNNDTLVSVSAPGYASSVQVTGGTVSLPPNSLVTTLTGPEPHIVLSDLTQPLTAGQAIPLTLNFEHAGSVTMQVPVEPQSFYYSSYSPAPTATPSPSTTAKPKSKSTATATPSTSSSATGTASPTATS